MADEPVSVDDMSGSFRLRTPFSTCRWKNPIESLERVQVGDDRFVRIAILIRKDSKVNYENSDARSCLTNHECNGIVPFGRIQLSIEKTFGDRDRSK